MGEWLKLTAERMNCAMSDAAVTIVRDKTLEEAARVCDVTPCQPFRPSIEAAWAIRALIGANRGL